MFLFLVYNMLLSLTVFSDMTLLVDPVSGRQLKLKLPSASPRSDVGVFAAFCQIMQGSVAVSLELALQALGLQQISLCWLLQTLALWVVFLDLYGVRALLQ